MSNKEDKSPLRIALAGLGTVGTGTLQLLEAQSATLAQRCGRSLQVVAVADLDCKRDRGIDMTNIACYDDALKMIAEVETDVVVELIGGSDGIAKKVCEAALDAGRHVVTANKALIAHHGLALAQKAEAAGAVLSFEAAVAGGIPIIKALREGLVGNNFTRITGILNGTCNYILTNMRQTGKEFGIVLDEAQKLGYAEADPSFDVDGVDAAHKLAILTSVAFGCKIDFGAVHMEGIRNISARDIALAGELGYRIKLFGITRRTEDGVEQRVHPCLVPLDAPLAHVEDVFNAVEIEGDYVGRSTYEGRGAGDHPTASAVVADIADIAKGLRLPTFGVPVAELADIPTQPMERHCGAYYLRFTVKDAPGVLAAIATELAAESISLASMIQHDRANSPSASVSIVLTTHETVEASMSRALAKIAALETVTEPPMLIRIQGG